MVGGLASLAMFLAHGGTFLSLRTSGPVAWTSAVLAVVLEHAADRSLLWVTHRQEELAFFPEVRSLDTVPG